MAVYQAGHVCGDSVDLIDGKPTGSVRISFGFSSTLDDAQQFLRFVYECFVDNTDITVSAVNDVTNSISATACHNPTLTSAAADEVPSTDAANSPSHVGTDALQLVRIFVYPVKSCAAVEVNCFLLSFR